MAHFCPTLPRHLAIKAGEYAELELLETLERGLSDAYTLFHSVDWSRGAGEQEQHGEIDIVVVNQAGDVLLIEVKAGDVDFLPGGIFKTYGDRTKNITAQVGLQYGALRTRLADACLTVHLSHLLVMPNLSRTSRNQKGNTKPRSCARFLDVQPIYVPANVLGVTKRKFVTHWV